MKIGEIISATSPNYFAAQRFCKTSFKVDTGTLHCEIRDNELSCTDLTKYAVTDLLIVMYIVDPHGIHIAIDFYRWLNSTQPGILQRGVKRHRDKASSWYTTYRRRNIVPPFHC